jgi:hypothetical protein
MCRHIVSRAVAVSALLLVSAGCYHSIIETGLEPGETAYHEKWETAWLVGLIPAEVDAFAVCGGRWARVETQQSFLNGLVSLLTLGIYSPHEVEVVCAASGTDGNSESPHDAENPSPPPETEPGPS